MCAEVSPTLNTTWGKRSPGSQAQEWDSEKGGRFVLMSSPHLPPAGEELSAPAKAEDKIR